MAEITKELKRFIIPVMEKWSKDAMELAVSEIIKMLANHKFEGDREEYNILLIGGTGAGKSTLGNFLIGSYKFDISDEKESKTKGIDQFRFTVDSKVFNIIDSEGILDSTGKPTIETIKTIIGDLHSKGIKEIDHVFICFDAENLRINAEKLKSYGKLSKHFSLYDHRNQLTFILRYKGEVHEENKSKDARLLMDQIPHLVCDDKFVLCLCLLDDDDRYPSESNFKSIISKHHEKRNRLLQIILHSSEKNNPVTISKCWPFPIGVK